MKNLILTTLLFLSFNSLFALNHADKDSTYYRIIQTDGTELIVQILNQDESSVIALTEDNRRITIPQYVIKEIIPVKPDHFDVNGKYRGSNPFASRNYIASNAIPLERGKGYVQWNLYGPDFQFGLAHDVSFGITATWIGSPVILNVQKSWKLAPKIHLATGLMAGSGAWASPESYGLLPFGTLTLGDKANNLSVSTGYSFIDIEGNNFQRHLLNISGQAQFSPKFSFVFESIIGLNTNPLLVRESIQNADRRQRMVALIPGIRWQKSPDKAVQLGAAGLINDHGVFPLPVPMLQIFYTL